jgi:DNA-binding NtrC family response regulator
MPRTCLIAAHDPWFIQLLRIYSEESGFRVVQAFEGQDVLPSIHKEHPQVILMQVDLPGQLQVQDVFKSIQTDAEASSIPLLMFSWEGHQAEQEIFHFSCMQLTEPVTYDNFTDALKKSGISLPKSDGEHGRPRERSSRRAGNRK